MADPAIEELIASKLGGVAGQMAPDMPMGEEPLAPMIEDAGDPVDAAAGDLIAAVQSGDKAGVVSALRLAFKALELEPHIEGGEQE